MSALFKNQCLAVVGRIFVRIFQYVSLFLLNMTCFFCILQLWSAPVVVVIPTAAEVVMAWVEDLVWEVEWAVEFLVLLLEAARAA